ncbi:MAG: lytic transglycosylase domain-containing protein, partial [Candidatus Aenigmarchaeota archaeon]|nr:lytic transglycosylase domain-containing protein [Candidatus Aenigmarchaeota archaeon]
NSAVTSKTWGFRSMTFTNEEMIAFIEGIMKQESNGDQFAVSSGCGAAGLMQFMPGTAKDYGMTKIYQDSSITTCDPVYSDSLSKLSNSQKLQQDDRFDPNKEIPAAVNFVYDLMDGLYPYTSDRNELLKFTAAAYNAGLGRVRTEIQRKLPTYPSYNDIASQLPQQTQTYVQIVFGNFQSYSQCTLASGGTYYNYDSTNQKFVKRPFTLNVRAEDYFSVLSCGNDMKSYAWSNKDDMACCGGSLWACGVDIPRLPGYRKLGESEKLTNARFIGDTAAGICTDLLTKARYPQQPVFTEDWGDKCFVVTLECNSSAFIVPPYEVSCDPAQQTNVCSRSTIYNSRTECLKTTGCFWKSGESHCIVCSSTNDCRTFDNSDACGVCPVTGKTCVQEYTGSDYNTWKCNAKTS